MQLNFKLNTPAFRAQCAHSQTARKHCITVTAVHEMMHAIGFLHEHLRQDAPRACKEMYGGVDVHGDRPIALSQNYDDDSIMTYCKSIYRMPIKLSTIDIEAIEYFYKLQ